jgi:hydrogenase nickel incorporation protein HypB
MTELRQVHVKESLLKANDFVANALRDQWSAQGSFVVNLLSSPGSGKTTLLEKALPKLQEKYRLLVLEGDLETERDAERIRGVGVRAVQITTGGACHLEAHQIQQSREMLSDEGPWDFVFIENVGNLVCPASYDLGEHLRTVLLSVPEGEDKPPKYPKAFHSSHQLLVTKCDLLEHFDFRVEEVDRLARELRPDIQLIRTSARTGEGIDTWIESLEAARERALLAR